MTMNANQSKSIQESPERILNKRLETIGWALFLIMIGGIGLVPKGVVPEATWLIGVGVIMLGLNVARSLNGIKMSNFTSFVGALALIIGVSGFFGVQLPIFAILLILIGANILLRPLFEREAN